MYRTLACRFADDGLSTEWIAEGCGVLGTGGGGSTYPPFLMTRQILREGKEIIVSVAWSSVPTYLHRFVGC